MGYGIENQWVRLANRGRKSIQGLMGHLKGFVFYSKRKVSDWKVFIRVVADQKYRLCKIILLIKIPEFQSHGFLLSSVVWYCFNVDESFRALQLMWSDTSHLVMYSIRTLPCSAYSHVWSNELTWTSNVTVQ